MANFAIHAGRGVARAVAFAAIGITALALASPASAQTIVDKHVEVPNCNTSGQLCPPKVGTQFYANEGSIKVEFTANQNHCSDIIAHVFFDYDPWGSNVVHPAQTDGGYEIPIDRTGLHRIDYQGEGITGGCNPGFLGSWGGTIHIEQL